MYRKGLEDADGEYLLKIGWAVGTCKGDPTDWNLRP